MTPDEKNPWNHNYAYNRWIDEKIGGRKRILDVGCGNGVLAEYLASHDNSILGIDLSEKSIRHAEAQNTRTNVSFIVSAFEDFVSDGETFDALVFSASIHHMNMKEALLKAKTLLVPGGILIIVGLAKPSNLADWIIEVARVIPSAVISAVRRNTSSEEMNMSVSYDFPAMKEVRQVCCEELPGYRMKYGLHYRYLLTWVKG